MITHVCLSRTKGAASWLRRRIVWLRKRCPPTREMVTEPRVRAREPRARVRARVRDHHRIGVRTVALGLGSI